MLRHSLAVLSVLSVLSPAPSAQSLPKRLDARLDAPPFDRQLWGVALVDEKGALLYGRNPRQLFIPASNTKLVVARRRLGAAAARLDGEDQPLRRGPVSGRRPPGRPGALRPGRPDLRQALLRHRHAARGRLRDRPVRPAAPAGRRRSAARGVREVARRPGGRRQLLRAAHWSIPAGRRSTSTGGTRRRSPASASTTTASTSSGSPGTAAGAPGGDHDVARRGRRGLREPHRHGAGRRPSPTSATASSASPARSTCGPKARSRSTSRRGTESFAHARSRTCSPRAPSGRCCRRRASRSPAPPGRPPTRLLYRQARAARRRWPRSRRARSATGSSRSSTAARTGSPRWCSSSSAGSSAAAGSWPEGLAVERRFLIDSVRVDSTEFSLVDGSGLSSGNLMSPARVHPDPALHPAPSARPRRFAAGLPQSGSVGSLRQPVRAARRSRAGCSAKDGSIAGVNSLSGYIERPDGKAADVLGAGQPPRPAGTRDDSRRSTAWWWRWAGRR